jgi:hypothetical protein
MFANLKSATVTLSAPIYTLVDLPYKQLQAAAFKIGLSVHPWFMGAMGVSANTPTSHVMDVEFERIYEAIIQGESRADGR